MLELIPASKISSSALEAERVRMDTIANNLANIQSFGKDGQVYQRKVPLFESVFNESMDSSTGALGGVALTEVVNDTSRKPTMEYMPYHPDADENGMVMSPNIAPMEEMVDMVTATRAYEASLSIIKESRRMADKTIDILKA